MTIIMDRAAAKNANAVAIMGAIITMITVVADTTIIATTPITTSLFKWFNMALSLETVSSSVDTAAFCM